MHRYRFKSIGLAPVSEKTQTIPIPTNDDTSSDATSQSAVTSFISPPDTQKAEVLWVLHTVTRHNSFKSNDDIRGVFAAMFPDSQLAKSFTCGEKKRHMSRNMASLHSSRRSYRAALVRNHMLSCLMKVWIKRQRANKWTFICDSGLLMMNLGCYKTMDLSIHWFLSWRVMW